MRRPSSTPRHAELIKSDVPALLETLRAQEEPLKGRGEIGRITHPPVCKRAHGAVDGGVGSGV